MDDITSRTIVIAVGIFVTLTIITMLILTFTKMQDIYGAVSSTNTSIYERFDDIYSMYDQKEENGLGLVNTIKKYEGDTENSIIVNYPNKETIVQNALSLGIRESEYLKNIMEKNENKEQEKINGVELRYQDKYIINVSEDNEYKYINFYNK